jgi:DNA invertase Pin-like site-specific DNA recombinase
MAEKFVSYIRVSTKTQGESGLGLEAQQKAVTQLVKQREGTLLAEFREVESGRVKNRPALQEALAFCRQTEATLVIAKLDRLARNVKVIADLIESQVSFVCCDNPHASVLTLHILAAVAQEEARLVSERTRAALAAARSRGTRLGARHPAFQAGLETRRRKREALIERVRPIIESGLSHAKMADALNAQGIRNLRGQPWTKAAVQTLICRWVRPGKRKQCLRHLPQTTLKRLLDLRAEGHPYHRVAQILNDEGYRNTRGGYFEASQVWRVVDRLGPVLRPPGASQTHSVTEEVCGDHPKLGMRLAAC